MIIDPGQVMEETLREKCFLITGATGLIGSSLIRGLLWLNAERNLHLRILALVRSHEKARSVFRTEYNCNILKFFGGGGGTTP